MYPTQITIKCSNGRVCTNECVIDPNARYDKKERIVPYVYN